MATVKNQRPGINATRLSAYLTKQIEALKDIKSQREIAADLGYPKANIISMFKSGEAKVPLDKLPALARSLGVDLGLLLKLGLDQYFTDDKEGWIDLTRVMDRAVTANELEIIQFIREVANGSDPRLDDEAKVEIKKAFSR